MDNLFRREEQDEGRYLYCQHFSSVFQFYRYSLHMLAFVLNSVRAATGNSISFAMSLIRKIKHTYRKKCWNTARESTVSMAMSMVFQDKSRDKFGGKGPRE